MDRGSHGWNPLDWGQLGNIFGGKPPFGAEGQGLGWVEQFVQDVLKQTLPRDAAVKQFNPFQVEMFETLNHVIVKFSVPENISPRSLRVHSSINQLRLEAEDGRSQTVTLPALVRTNGVRASFKEGILQVKIIKRKTIRHWDEIPIRYL